MNLGYIAGVWWAGYLTGNHGWMGWAVAMSDMVGQGMVHADMERDPRSSRRWAGYFRDDNVLAVLEREVKEALDEAR